MISILTAIACSDYEIFTQLNGKEDDAMPAVPLDTGTDDPPAVVTEDTGWEDKPEDSGYTPPLDTGGGTQDTPAGDTIPTSKEYLLDICATHVSPDHCPLDPDLDDIPECRNAIVYDPTAVDALKTSVAGLTIFATMDTAPADASDISIAYLHLSEGDNRDAVMAEFAKESEDGGYAGDMSQHRFVNVPHVDCFSHDFPLNRNRIDLDPSVEFGNNGYGYNEARLRWSNTSGDYRWASVGNMTYDDANYVTYDTEAGYFIYGTELMVDNNNGDLKSLVKSLTADNGAVPETWSSVSRWTMVYYVP